MKKHIGSLSIIPAVLFTGRPFCWRGLPGLWQHIAYRLGNELLQARKPVPVVDDERMIGML